MIFGLALLGYLGNLNAKRIEIGTDDPENHGSSSVRHDKQNMIQDRFLERARQWNQMQENMDNNADQLSRARNTNDPIEQYRVSSDVLKKNKRGIDFADAFLRDIKHWEKKYYLVFNVDLNDISRKRKQYDDEKNELKKELPELEKKAYIELNKHEEAMASNDFDRKRSDATNDPLERYCSFKSY